MHAFDILKEYHDLFFLWFVRNPSDTCDNHIIYMSLFNEIFLA